MNGATPNSWMVYFMESPVYKWMRTGGTPTSETPYDRDISWYIIYQIYYISRNQHYYPILSHIKHYIWTSHDIYIYIYPIYIPYYPMWNPYVFSSKPGVSPWNAGQGAWWSLAFRGQIHGIYGIYGIRGIRGSGPPELKAPLKKVVDLMDFIWIFMMLYGFDMGFMWILELHISPCWS